MAQSGSSDGPYRRLASGKATRCYGSWRLPKASSGVLEEQALKGTGHAAAPRRGSIEQSLTAFEADPAGPEAQAHISSIAEEIEGMPESERAAFAERVAGRIANRVERASPRDIKGIASAIGPQVARRSTLGGKTVDLIKRRSSVAVAGEIAPGARAGARVVSLDGAGGGNAALIMRFVDEYCAERGILLPDSDGSRLIHVDRNGKVHVRPTSRVKRLAKAAAALVLAGLIGVGVMAVRGSEPGPVGAQKAGARSLEESYQAAVADDAGVLEAVRKAVDERHAGPLNIQQIMDIYDYVSKNTIYLSALDKKYPLPAGKTLAAGRGDCKSLATLLAAMLESAAAKTVIFAGRYGGVGHVFVAVKISDGPGDGTESAVKALIARRYKKKIKEFYGGMYRPAFRKITKPGIEGEYLVLDTAMPPQQAVPGKTVDISAARWEKMIEPRPGARGLIPEL